MKIKKFYRVSVEVDEDKADDVNEEVISGYIGAGLEDDDIDAKLDVEPENAENAD